MITRADINALSRLHSDRWPIVSLLLRVDKERIDEDYEIRLKNLLRSATEELDQRFDHEQVEAINADLQRLKEFFRDEGARFGRGVAVFVSTKADIWQVHELPRDIPSCITIDFAPHVAPLIEMMEQVEPYCACLIARNNARIFLGRLGSLEELAQVYDEDVPGQHDQGGWSQARYERHIEEHVRGHFKRVAEDLFSLFDEHPFRWLVLGGTEEVVSGFAAHLHPYLRERYVGSVRLLMESNIKEVHKESSDVIRAWLRTEKERALEMLRNEVLSGDRGAAGIEQSIEAAQQGQILTLLVNNGFQVAGTVCSGCGMIQPDGPGSGTCPYCGGNREHVPDIVPRLVTSAFQQDASVLFLNAPELQEQLHDIGDIGALLRFRLASSQPDQ